MGPLTISLLQKYGDKWTHALAINDLYFDFMGPALRSAGIRSNKGPQAGSAGDGSEAAFQRIRSGSYQTITVAEPLNLQGWQLVDELNRAIQGEACSGYITSPALVTEEGLKKLGDSNQFDPDSYPGATFVQPITGAGVDTPLVQMRGIAKRFGGVTALSNVDLDAHAGEVLAIVGDNGAGKSTLIKILTGVYQPTSGEMFLDQNRVKFASHADAIQHGIDAVYQTLALADHLPPAANMFLGNELTKNVLGMKLLDNKRMRRECERVLMERLGVKLKSMDAPTESLSGGQRQAVAIARAVYHEGLRVLVMDEPTAALGPQETARTLKLIKTLKEQGLAVILISHSLDDVFEVSDRIHVQRRGQCAGVVMTAQSNNQEVLGMIVGAKEAA